MISLLHIENLEEENLHTLLHSLTRQTKGKRIIEEVETITLIEVMIVEDTVIDFFL